MIGFLTDSIVIAWPLEVMLWVVLGFWAARRGANRNASTWAYVISTLALALIYGVVLSRFVELA
jgi:F0F1-type ATP synthase assembly protein I